MSLGKVQKKNQLIYRFHPNINLDYFKIIDITEKAYWLGWLFAEAWVSRQKTGIRFGVEISIKEEILIDRFINAIGFNPRYKRYRLNNKKVGIRLLNVQFTNNLIKHGFIIGCAKSKSIQLPKLSSYKLYLAFLLGYYDGDGKVRISRINCGSKDFLIQIQDLFGLNYKITKKTSGGPIKGREIHGECFEMGLGKDLFNDMLDNYQLSLPRKRVYL
ncbi:MAG: LAGLIDADG family homing endonuclease [Candidatus Odinarchaeota archaeon]